MITTRNLFRMTLGFLCAVALIFAAQATTPAAALAPAGFTNTPTTEPPTDTPSPTPVTPTATNPNVPPIFTPTFTPTATEVIPGATDTPEPEPSRRRTSTPTGGLLLPVTGELPPDQGLPGWNWTLPAAVLLAALLGLLGGFLLRSENRQKLLAWIERRIRVK